MTSATAMLLLVAVTPGTSGALAPTVPVYLNGEQVPLVVATEQQRALAPVRGFLEALGARVVWLPPATVAAYLNGHALQLTVGKDVAILDGQRTAMDTPAKTVSGQTYAGLRFLAEAMRAGVHFDGQVIHVQPDHRERLRVEKGPLHVHSAPGESEPVVLTLPAGTILEVVSQDQDWTQVRLRFDRLGWVQRPHLDVVPAVPYLGYTALAEIGGRCLGPGPIIDGQLHVPRDDVWGELGIWAPGSAGLVSVRPLAERFNLRLLWEGHRRTAALEPSLSTRSDAERCSPLSTAAAYIVLDSDTGLVLAEQNADRSLPVASTTKIMTAVLALERGQPESRVLVSSRAAQRPCTCAGLRGGRDYSLGDLLVGLMLPSGNDAATAIAEHLAGSEDQFAAEMTRRAGELGATDTAFRDASGLNDQGYSSARDLAVVARHALAMPMFRALAGATRQTVGDGRSLANLNSFLSQYPGASGVKNGWTPGAGYTLVASAYRDGHELIVVVLGAQSRNELYREAIRLMDHGFTLSRSAWLVQAGLTGHYAPGL